MSKILGPYSSNDTLSKPDGRTKAARLLKSLRRDLIAHVGGAPSLTQRLLIDQAAQIQLRLKLMDADGVENGIMSERNTRQYLAWANTLNRLIRQIGLKGAAQTAPSLREHLAKRPA